ELMHGRRYSESYMESLPDFVKLADSFGALGLRATKPEEVDSLIGEMIKEDRAVIADVCIDPNENCFPMIPSGAAHNEILFAPDHGEGKGRENGMVLV
ncbi:MAG: acetolactate synthase 3 large subunit, partial [Alphaproteobacteria bacterium]|nr:acetolactate synthase 3 large subunit [Alphaproteobacteria bacterium]